MYAVVVIMILDTAEHARQAAAIITTRVDAQVAIRSTNVYEVTARV